MSQPTDATQHGSDANWSRRIVVALLVAVPNLLTLGIVLGTGSGSHAGDRILDVEAPAFRGATLAGALIAAGLIAIVWYLGASRRRAWRRAERIGSVSDGHVE